MTAARPAWCDTGWGHEMRKISPYGRKLQRRQQDQNRELAERDFLDKVQRDVRGLQIDAGLHCWTGNNASTMVNTCGRLLYIVAFAARAAGVSHDYPDLRILRGMSEALGDLAGDLHAIERHRASIQSGLSAIDRLLPLCTLGALLEGAHELEQRLNSVRGMGTQDVRELTGVGA